VAVAPNSKERVALELFQKVAPLRAGLAASNKVLIVAAAIVVGVEVEASCVVVGGLSKGIVFKS
jgi:hypothetical protein